MHGIFISIMDEINVGQWSSGQVGEGKSMCLRLFRSLCGTGERYFRSNRKMERSSWRSQAVFVVPRRSGTRRRTDWMEYQWNLEAEERQMYHSLQWSFLQIQNSYSKQFTLSLSSVSTQQLRIGVINSAWQKKRNDESLFLWTIQFWPWWSPKKWNCWYLLQPRCLETGCKEAYWASKPWKRRYSLHNSVKNAFFQHLVIARSYDKIRPDEDDGWSTVALLCREYSSSRSHPKSKALSAIPEGTIIGPVSEVHVAKILDWYCMNVAIQSIANPEYTTYVVISREEERFVN